MERTLTMQLHQDVTGKLPDETAGLPGKVLRPLWREAMEDIRADHRAGVDGRDIAERIAVAMDAVVLAINERVADHARGRHALVALGGYGRCEMAPHSDVDLLFLFEKDQGKSPEFISGVLNPLWDMAFEVGHSSRTLGEVARYAREDLASCTAMMDGRLLAGDEGLYVEFLARLYSKVPSSTVTRLNNWRLQRIEARQSVQLLEPNVKESPGGLREMQVLALKEKF